MAESIPTDNPETALPTHKSTTSVDDTCKMFPTLNMRADDTMIENFLPHVSDINGAINAPKNVPSDKMAVINARSCTLKLCPFAGKLSFTYVISIISLMSPVSYPYKNPPTAATSPTVMALDEDDFCCIFL
jgi:hypothetical protein